MVKSSAIKILITKSDNFLPFAAQLLQTAKIEVLGHARHYISVVQPTFVNVPKYDEQTKIGSLFITIDNLITLHQRKCKRIFIPIPQKNELNNYIKNAITWEQRKLKEIADRYDNLRIPVASNLRVAGTTPYYGANGIQDYVDGFTHEGEFVLVAEDGANDLKNYPVNCVKGRIWVNNHAHVLQGKQKICNNSFLAYLINRANIEALLVGGGRVKLNSETMMNIDLLKPKLNEQNKIGTLFQQLDNLITLHLRL